MMKVRPRQIVTAILAAIGLVIVATISFRYPHWILTLSGLTFIPTYFLLILCLFPVGGLSLGVYPTKPSFFQWFFKILLAQFFLAVISLGAFLAFFGIGPPKVQETKVTLDFMLPILESHSWGWGIFPWSVYALWGLVISYVTYIKKGKPYLYQLGNGFLPKFFEPAFKSYSEATTTAAAIFIFSLMASIIILLFSYTLENIFHNYHFIFPFITVFVLSFITPIFGFKLGRMIFRGLLRKKGSFSKLYVFIILLMIVLLMIAGYANNWFKIHYGYLYQTLVCRQCEKYFGIIPPPIRFASFVWGWFIIWSPIAGSYLCKISKGRTLREFIFGVFVVPIIIAGLILIWGINPFQWVINQMVKVPAIIFLPTLATIIWFLFAKLLGNRWESGVFLTGLLEDKSINKSRMRLALGSKTTSVVKLAPQLLISVLGVLFLHVTLGWYGIQLQVTAAGFVVLGSILHGVILLTWRIFKDKAWFGNQNIPPFQ